MRISLTGPPAGFVSPALDRAKMSINVWHQLRIYNRAAPAHDAITLFANSDGKP